MKALVLVYGDVHGVGFRSYCQGLAKQSGLAGLCCNEAGGVRVFLDGDKNVIEKFLQIVREIKPQGFFGANVEKVEVHFEGEAGFKPAWRSYEGFQVDY